MHRTQNYVALRNANDYRGVSGMEEKGRVEVEFDDRRYSALQHEADRLGCDISTVVYKATAAWLCEMADHGVLDFTDTARETASA